MICPMCQFEVEKLHQRSHVLPDWMFHEVYSADHKLISLDMNNESAQRRQSATHGSYWCNKCEERSGVDDRYGSLILTDKSPGSPEYSNIQRKTLKKEDLENPGIELWTGVDFKRFQNFVFSCVFRGELFSRIERKELIGQKHFSGMKEIYADPRALDCETYPIILVRSPEEDEYRTWSFLPHRTRFGDHNGVMFRGGGFQFQVYVSSHVKPTNVMLARATKLGEIPVIVDHYKNTGSFKGSVPKIGNIIEKYPPAKFAPKRNR